VGIRRICESIEWGVAVGRFLRRIWETRGGLEKPRRGKRMYHNSARGAGLRAGVGMGRGT